MTATCARDALRPDGIGAAIHDAAEAAGLTPDEGAMLVRSFLSAGVDTTVSGIAFALRNLAAEPEQWELLRHDPAVTRNAFEETIRRESPVIGFFRMTTGQRRSATSTSRPARRCSSSTPAPTVTRSAGTTLIASTSSARCPGTSAGASGSTRAWAWSSLGWRARPCSAISRARAKHRDHGTAGPRLTNSLWSRDLPLAVDALVDLTADQTSGSLEQLPVGLDAEPGPLGRVHVARRRRS